MQLTIEKVNKAKDSKQNHAFFSPKSRPEPLFFQPKLTIGPVDDIYEREADAVADQVMRMSDNQVVQTKFSPIGIQRMCPACEEEEKAQRKEKPGNSSAANEAPSIVNNVIGSGGKPLAEDTRSFMENRMGYDFSNVKIHTGSVAAKSARSINALAYTSGNNIVFNEGQYAPATTDGKRLLVHELTHTVQQGAALAHKKHKLQNSVNQVKRYQILQRAGGNNPTGNSPALPGLSTDLLTLENLLPQGELEALSALISGASEGEIVAYTAQTKTIGKENTLQVWAIKQGGSIKYSRGSGIGTANDLSNQGFIALAHRVVGGQQGLDIGYHYSLQFWDCGGGFADLNRPSGYTETEIKDVCGDANPSAAEAKKAASFELLARDQWKAWASNGDEWEITNVTISEIMYKDTGTKVMPIFSDDKTKAQTIWNDMVSIAKAYPYAEQEGFGGVFKNWPDSLYLWYQSNSNSFARHAVTQGGLNMEEMIEAHPGSMTPHQNTLRGLTLLGTPEGHPWEDGKTPKPAPSASP